MTQFFRTKKNQSMFKNTENIIIETKNLQKMKISAIFELI